MDSKKKLDPLDIKSLGGESQDIKLEPPTKCNHFFEYVTAQEIMCKHCYTGYTVDRKDYLKNGHLYHGKDLVL